MKYHITLNMICFCFYFEKYRRWEKKTRKKKRILNTINWRRRICIWMPNIQSCTNECEALCHLAPPPYSEHSRVYAMYFSFSHFVWTTIRSIPSQFFVYRVWHVRWYIQSWWWCCCFFFHESITSMVTTCCCSFCRKFYSIFLTHQCRSWLI